VLSTSAGVNEIDLMLRSDDDVPPVGVGRLPEGRSEGPNPILGTPVATCGHPELVFSLSEAIPKPLVSIRVRSHGTGGRSFQDSARCEAVIEQSVSGPARSSRGFGRVKRVFSAVRRFEHGRMKVPGGCPAFPANRPEVTGHVE